MPSDNLPATCDKFPSATWACATLTGKAGRDIDLILSGKTDHEPKFFSEIATIASLCDLFQDCETDEERIGIGRQILEQATAFAGKS